MLSMYPLQGPEDGMAKTDFQSVDEYLATLPDGVRATLERVRTVLREALPGAVEVISYQMPAYKLQGVPVLYFAAWKEHFSIYPAGSSLDEELRAELAGYEQSKGAIRFPLSEPVPDDLLRRIAKVRAKEAGTVAAERAVRRKRRTAT